MNKPAPILPVLPTTPARMTHDYVRHGTTSLFATLDLPAARSSPSLTAATAAATSSSCGSSS